MPANDLFEGDAPDAIRAQPYHRPGIVVGKCLDRRCPQATGKYAVESTRAPARLDMPEHRKVGLVGAPGVVDEVAKLLRGGCGAFGRDDREARLALVVGFVEELYEVLRAPPSRV